MQYVKVTREKGSYNRHIRVSLCCATICGASSTPTQSCRGTIDWSARKPWWQMDGEGEEWERGNELRWMGNDW